MIKSKGIYVDRNTLVEKINNICAENWEDYSVSSLYEIGNMHRCDIVVNNKKAMLNFFFKADGTTTIQVAGANTNISEFIKMKLESSVEYKGDVEAKTCSFKNLSSAWADKLIQYFEDSPEIEVRKTEINKIPKHLECVLISRYGDRLVINRFENGTVVLQGKPAYIYSEAIYFLSYCDDITVADIVESISSFNKVAVKTDDVDTELQRLLINSYNGLDRVILKLLSPAVALRKISIDLEDYSCFAFPALRALEGYIKWLLGKKGVEVGYSFYGVFKKYNLTHQAITKIGDKTFQSEIERLFKYLKDNRNVHFHADQMLLSTKLIEKRSEANSIVNEVIELIDSSYRNIVA